MPDNDGNSIIPYAVKQHDDDVIFSKESLEEFIRLIQRQGINNLTVYSVSDLLAKDSAKPDKFKYQTLTARFPPPTFEEPPQEFEFEELKDRKGYFVFVRYSFSWEGDQNNGEGPVGSTDASGIYHSKNELNGRHVFVKTINDIIFYKKYINDNESQGLDTEASSIFHMEISNENPIPDIVGSNADYMKDGTFTITVDNIQYVIKIKGFNDDGEYEGIVKAKNGDMVNDDNVDKPFNPNVTGNAYTSEKGFFLRSDGIWANSIDNDLLPVQSGQFDLGNNTYAWRNLYLSGNALPQTGAAANNNNGSDLGAANKRWRKLWAKDGDFSGDINISGDTIIGSKILGYCSPTELNGYTKDANGAQFDKDGQHYTLTTAQKNALATTPTATQYIPIYEAPTTSSNLIINGKTIQTNALPTSNGNTGQFWRGGGTNSASWSNSLEGPMRVLSAAGPTGNNIPGNTSGIPSDTNDGAADFYCSGAGYFARNLAAKKIFKAVYNDYAEFHSKIDLAPGHCVADNDDGSLVCTSRRLMPGVQVISDTFGDAMGYDENNITPLAVAGRVLVYTYQPRKNYHAGMAVCSAPNGTVDIMTREEIRDYPDCIVGIVSEIPYYEKWGTDQINIDGRIWIKVK